MFEKISTPRQNKIIKIVEEYKKYFYADNLTVIGSIKEQRSLQLNKFASTKDLSFRWGLRIPEDLMNLLDDAFGVINEKEQRFLENEKEMSWFMKEFPEYRISEKT